MALLRRSRVQRACDCVRRLRRPTLRVAQTATFHLAFLAAVGYRMALRTENLLSRSAQRPRSAVVRADDSQSSASTSLRTVLTRAD